MTEASCLFHMNAGGEEGQSEVEGPPRKAAFEEVRGAIASLVGKDFLLFDTNGYDFIATTTVEPIPTGIPIFVPLLVGTQE